MSEFTVSEQRLAALIKFFVFSVVYKGYIYVFGGFNSKEDRHFNDLHRFDPGKYYSLA